ncbi:MAG: exonuclease SbcCD subunit D [Candidatus Caldatribacteriota bacterium]
MADIHLGMENYGRIDPSTGLHTRLQDFIKCFSFAIDIALKEKVDLVIFAGDAYKNSTPNPTHQREFARQIYRLSDSGIPVVIVNGNHDIPVSFGKAAALDIFHTLKVAGVTVLSEPKLVNINTRSGPIQIFGLPWPHKNNFLTKDEYKNLNEEEMVKEIQRRVTDEIIEIAHSLNPEIPAIFVAHLTVAEATYSGSERSVQIGRDPVFPASVLAQKEFDYVALGHIHKFQDLNPNGSVPVVYSGSIERINFGEEKEEKGFCLIDIDQKRKGSTYQFIPVPARKFITIEVNLYNQQDPTETFLAELEKFKIDEAVVRIFYDLPEEKESLLDFKRIETALQKAFLVTTISKKTKPLERIKRIEISENLSMLEAMERYIKSIPELFNWLEDLKKYAQELEKELEELEGGKS